MNVLITGTSRGIGKAIKDKFLSLELSQNVYTPARHDMDLNIEESVDAYLESIPELK